MCVNIPITRIINVQDLADTVNEVSNQVRRNRTHTEIAEGGGNSCVLQRIAEEDEKEWCPKGFGDKN